MVDPTPLQHGTSGSSDANGGNEGAPPINTNLLLQIIKTEVSAGEDRVMRQLTEKTSKLEKELLGKMSEVIETVHGFKPGATWQQIAGIAFVVFTAIFAVLAFASDRFDSGVSSMGAIEEALDAQRELNATQDSRLDKILNVLEAQSAKPENGPQEGQN